MEFQVKDRNVEFSGFLNEQSPVETRIRDVLQQVGHAAAGSPVSLDLSRVKRANSCGILAWFKVMEKMSFPIIYVNAPIWMVEQLNFLDTLQPNVFVESIQAPFYCPENDSHQILTLRIGKEIPLRESYEEFAFVCTNEAGETLEPDFEPGEFLQFIATNLAKFRGAVK